MVKTLFTALFAVTLVLVFTTITFAQDKPVMEQKKEDVKAMTKDKMTKMDEKGKSGLMTVSCDPACGFRVTSHDAAELTEIVKTHSKVHHQQTLTDAEVKTMMRPAGRMGMGDKMKEGQMMEEKKKDESKPHDH